MLKKTLVVMLTLVLALTMTVGLATVALAEGDIEEIDPGEEEIVDEPLEEPEELPEDEVVATGDNTLYFAIAAVSLIAVSAVAVAVKKAR